MADLRKALAKVTRSANRSICGGVAPDIPSALDAVSQAYAQFLLDPRTAFQPQVVPIRHFDLIINLQKAARDNAQALAAIELCDILLRTASTNNITAESIKGDRRVQRMMLDWPYSETVPYGEPQPAEEQAYSYRNIASDLADAMMTAEQKSTDDAGDLDYCARDYGDGPLHAVASHPSLQFLHGWLLLKAGRVSELGAALRCFTAAAAHPLLRSSCLLLRGLCLLYLNKHDAAQQALTAGLELDALTGVPAGKAEPSLLIEAHSALAVIAALKAQAYSSNTSSKPDESSSKLAALQLEDDSHAGATDPHSTAPRVCGSTVPLFQQGHGAPVSWPQEGTGTAPPPGSIAPPAAGSSTALQAAPGSSPTHLPARPASLSETSVATATASDGMPGAQFELLQQARHSFRLAEQAAQAFGEGLFAKQVEDWEQPFEAEVATGGSGGQTLSETDGGSARLSLPEALKDHMRMMTMSDAASSHLLAWARWLLHAQLPNAPEVAALNAIINAMIAGNPAFAGFSHGSTISSSSSSSSMLASTQRLHHSSAAKGTVAARHQQRLRHALSGASALEPLRPYDSYAIILRAKYEEDPGLFQAAASWGDADCSLDDLPQLPGQGSYCQRCGSNGQGVQLQECRTCGRFSYCSNDCREQDAAVHVTACVPQ